MEEPEKKKRRGRPPKKKPASKKDFDPSITSMGALSALFALKEDPKQKRHDENIKAMCSHLEEYLANFIIIGYTVDGEAVQVTSARTPKDIDSLSTGLQRYVINSAYGTQFPPGNTF